LKILLPKPTRIHDEGKGNKNIDPKFSIRYRYSDIDTNRQNFRFACIVSHLYRKVKLDIDKKALYCIVILSI